jgi:crotonobetainyl-CoA:carnitine CoA-transferase CaiB-like acyl-CoA transferase
MRGAANDGQQLRSLEGIRIVSFTQFLLGPAAVQYLSDLGAEVIKVESPRGGAWERKWAGGETFLNEVSVFFLLSHRNAKSVALDLKQDAGREAALRLVDTADVLVENFRPGVLDSLGLGYDTVHERNPNVIYASASGYGTESPFRSLPGQDLLIQAMTGLPAATGSADQSPIAPGAAVVDQHAASLLAMGILAALVHRERTGRGQRIEVNMIQAALDLQLEPLTYHLNGGAVSNPDAPLGSGFHPAPYGLYPTSDGHVAISLSPVADVRSAFDGATALAPFEDPKIALRQRDDIYRAVAPLVAAYSTTDVLERLRAAGVWCARVNDYDAVFEDEAVRAVDPVMDVDHPEAGPVRLLRHPVSYSEADTGIRSLPPSLGQHTRETLAGLGYSESEIEELARAGAIR